MARRPSGGGRRGSTWELDRFLEGLAKGLETSYLLVGEERFLHERALSGLEQRVLAGAMPDYNFTRMVGPDADLDELVKVALTYPAFADRRLVEVRDLDLAEASDHPGFVALLKDPPPTTVLVVSVARLTREGSRRTKAAGEMARRFRVRLELAACTAGEARQWLQRFSRERKVRLRPEAGELLLELVGTGLGSLEAELEKLTLYALERGEIQRADVEAVTARTRAHTVWELTDALAAGDTSRALRELDVLLEDGAEPIGLVGILAFRVRQLLEGALLLREGLSGQALARRLRVYGAAAERLSETCSRTEPDRLVRSLEVLRQADDALKSTRINPRILLERAILGAVARGPAGAGRLRAD